MSVLDWFFVWWGLAILVILWIVAYAKGWTGRRKRPPGPPGRDSR